MRQPIDMPTETPQRNIAHKIVLIIISFDFQFRAMAAFRNATMALGNIMKKHLRFR